MGGSGGEERGDEEGGGKVERRMWSRKKEGKNWVRHSEKIEIQVV